MPKKEKVVKLETKKEELIKTVDETIEIPASAPAVSYEVGIQGTELYNLTATTEQISVQDLIQSQAVIEINTIMTLIKGGEGVGTVALYKSIKDALVVESIKSIVETDTTMTEETKTELKEFFKLDEIAVEETTEALKEEVEKVDAEIVGVEA